MLPKYPTMYIYIYIYIYIYMNISFYAGIFMIFSDIHKIKSVLFYLPQMGIFEGVA